MSDTTSRGDEAGKGDGVGGVRRGSFRGRWWWAGGVGVLLLLLLVVALLPTLLSTGVGTRWVQGLVSDRIGGAVTIDEARFGWFGGQRLGGVTLLDPERGVVARVLRVEAPDLRLIPVAMGRMNLGRVTVEVDEAVIRQVPGEATNLERAVAPARPERARPEAPTQIGGLGVSLNVTARRVVYESPDLEPVELSDLRATAEMADPRRVRVTLRSQLQQAGESGRVDADVTIDEAFTAEGVLQAERAQVEGRAEATNLPVPMLDRLAQQGGLLEALLGERLSARVQTAGRLDALDATIAARSERLSIDTRVARTGRGLEASEGVVSLQLTPAAFDLLTAGGAGGAGSVSAAERVRLLEPVAVAVDLRGLLIPADEAGLGLAAAGFDAVATADRVAMDVPGQGRVLLRGVHVELGTLALSERLVARLSAEAEIAGAAGPVSARAEVSNLLLEGSPLVASVETQRFPSAVADVVLGFEGRLARLLGGAFDGTLNATREVTGDLVFEGTLASPNLRGPFAGGYTAEGVATLSTPSPADLILTPASWRDWVVGADAGPEQFVLAEPAQLTVMLDRLTYASVEAGGDEPEGTRRMDPDRTSIVGTIGIRRALLQNPQQRVLIEDGTVELRGEDLRDVLRIIGEMNVRDPAGGGEPGRVSTDTQLRRMFDEHGVMYMSGAAIRTQTRLVDAPSGMLDSLLGQGGDLSAVLGPVVSLVADVDYDPRGPGRADVSVESSNVTGRVPAEFAEGGVLHLREDAELNVRVTPEVSRVLLGRVSPLLSSVVSAEAPLRLTVASEGFGLPMQAFDWGAVSARASLETGTMTLAPRGFAGMMMPVLSQFANLPQQDAYRAAMSPVALAIDRGRMRYDDLRVGFAGVELGFGGTVDLGAQRYNLNMRLGGDALRVRELQGLTIPLSGTFDQPISQEALTQAFAGAAMQLGGQRLLQQLMGGDRDAEASRDGRSPLDVLLDRATRGREPQPPQEQRREQGQEQQPPTSAPAADEGRAADRPAEERPRDEPPQAEARPAEPAPERQPARPRGQQQQQQQPPPQRR